MEEFHPNCTLARLSFWVPAGRLREFEIAYEARIAPILKKHGLVESSERGRPTAEGMFSRLFAAESPAAVAARRAALEEDPAWQELGKTFAADPQRQAIGERLARGFAEREYLTGRLDLYSTPAGPGKRVKAGPGKQRAAGRGRGRWRTFAATDGLPCVGAMRAILQDAEGALWIGNFGGGLSRYDGQQFRTYTARDGLTSRLVQDVILAQDGTLWIGTHGNGIYHYDGQRFENLTVADGLVSDLVLRVFQDREGCLWAGTFWGLSRWDGRSFTSFTTRDGLPADEVHAIAQDREGCLWFGTGDVAGGRKGGACRYDGHRFTSFTTEDGPAANRGVWSILQDQEGFLWFGTAGGVSRYDGEEFKTFTTEDGLGSNEVWAILQDREGALWFGTKYGGVSRYDGQGFTTFTAEDGLGYDSVEAICQDREGALWFGTWGGLSRYEAQTFTTFTAQDGLPDDQVLSVCQDWEGALWFGTEKGGLCRYDGHTFTTFTTEDGLPDNRVSLLFQDREGVLWFGFTRGTIQPSGLGVCRYDGHTFTTFSVEDGLADDKVESIFQDREGALWFGTGGKVSRYDGHAFCTFTVADGLACGNGIFVMTQDQEGVLWFGVTGGGVSRYDGQQFTTFTEADGLVSDVVSMLQDREGVLWFGTYGGVRRYDGQKFIPFATQDGLAEDVGAPIMQDRQGRIWFSTSTGGVHCYDGQVFQALTTQDGLAGNWVSSAIFQDQEGSLWFGTQRGVTRYRPPAPSPPPLFLDAVVADRRYEGVSEVEIPVSVKMTAFAFHALSFKTRSEAMIYRYRLEGYEEEWRNTHSRRVEYQDLPLGEYTFQVRAVDRDLNYSNSVGVHLKVVPDPRDQRIDELEQRVRERTARLEEANRLLEEQNLQIQLANQHKSQFLSRMSHDLRTPMNAILGYTRILLRKTQGLLDQRQYQNLQNIQLSADQLLALINDILDLSRVEAGRIELKPEQVELKQLVQECAVSVESLLKPGVELHQQLAEIAPLHTDPDRLRRVLMNLLSNAVKFTEAGSITVAVRRVEDWVELSVADTGIGIPAEDLPHIFEEFRQSGRRGEGEKQGSGLGLAIAKKSVELLGGSIAVESQVGKGTKFTLRIRDYEGR